MLIIAVTFSETPEWRPLMDSLWADCRFFQQATNFAISKGYRVDWAGALARGLLVMAKAGANLVELQEAAERATKAWQDAERLGWPGSGRFA